MMKRKSKVKAMVVVFCLLILIPFFLVAIPDQDGDQTRQQPEKEESVVKEQPVTEFGGPNDNMPELPMSDSFSFIQSLMALSFVLGLIFLAAYFFKKVTGIKSTGLRKSKVPISVVGNMPLGDKKFLSVVEIAGKYYFIGITQNTINLLSELQLDFPVSEGEAEEEAFESIFHKARVLLNKVKK